MLEVRDLSFSYPSGEGKVDVRSWDLAAGETVAVVGPSGAGKTTFLRLLAGMLEPKRGMVRFEGTNLLSLSVKARREVRLRRMGVVFQDFALLDYLTVGENLLLPQVLGSGVPAGAQDRARELADKLEVGRYWDKASGQLSQGERQRVAIARALVHEPKLILADEPTASLDEKRKAVAVELLLSDARSRGVAMVMVTHDPGLLGQFDKVIEVEGLGA